MSIGSDRASVTHVEDMHEGCSERPFQYGLVLNQPL
jgi:hypothetical protein